MRDDIDLAIINEVLQ